MAKTKFEKYYSCLKNNPRAENIKKMIFFTEDQYVITNSYSLLLLNERPSGKYDNFTTIGSFLDKFHTENTDKNIDVEKTQGDKKEKMIIYNKEYGFKYSFYSNMKSIIKPDKIEVGFWGEVEPKPILFLENTKTQEKGYLLPIKSY